MAASAVVVVMVRLRCPLGHVLPVDLPQGTPVHYRCRACGREYEGAA